MTPPRSESTTDVGDALIAEVLQRLARARTNLVLAERTIARPRPPGASPDPSELVESARVDLLWATASAILAPESERSRRRLVDARARLAELLERLGFESYSAFALEHPPQDDDAEPELQAARDEFETAAAAWESVQARLLDVDRPVIDLTDDPSS